MFLSIELISVIIKEIDIEKFRGFKNVGFQLGEQVTLIAGQNGTQKSTLLGILSQTFTIPNSGHSFSDEIPLSGGSYRSAFQDKFRLSPNLDIAGEHEWTLYFHDQTLHPDIDEDGGFTVESITRSEKSIRFWQKGNREAGSGYVQLPVIYLSLKRLIPLAEAGKVESVDIQLTQKEKKWFSDTYNNILISDDDVASIDYLEGRNKNTLAVTTDYYDLHSNSAGQDNLGRILLSVISFMRLKDKYPDDYKGGILAIDEIDATLYPGSQVKLLEMLSQFCTKAGIQIIATTHSLPMLERICELKMEKGRFHHFNCAYLKKVDGEVEIEQSPDFERILHNLNVSTGKKKRPEKILVHTEDEECTHFAKAILGRQFKNLKFSDIPLGCGNLIQLGEMKVPGFCASESIVVLDGDARKNRKLTKLTNYVCLPGDINPEGMIATYLNSLSDRDKFWKERDQDYTKQVCFSTYKYNEILKDRIKAKAWYREQVAAGYWGRQGSLVFKCLLNNLEIEKQEFIEQFGDIYSSVTK